MLRKINVTLAILCLLGALFIGGVALYSKYDDISKNKAAMTVWRDISYDEKC